MFTALSMLSSTAFADVNYTVQKGDSYWNIAQKFNTSVNSVMESNNAGANTNLMVGQIIRIPSNSYTVQKGDTYYLIAKKCAVSLSSLLDANNANGNSTLYPGQTVTIPDNENGYTSYTVQKGDTYWIISQKYSVSLLSICFHILQ